MVKLYADTNSDYSDVQIRKLIGTDYWIKCKISIFAREYYIQPCYILRDEWFADGERKILDTLYYHMVSESRLQTMDTVEPIELEHQLEIILNHTCNTPIEDIHVFRPLELLTTDEICDMFKYMNSVEE